ncbi:MAG TPA: peptide chain release factor N(5)-glutamine methyltransferase [Bacteroidales bacterium]|nr:peptide chain release factor N(5)-glutamine methyltransferase [Bacteroidales bacterium]
MASIISIKKVISNIKYELKEFYPMNEIDSFVYLIFDQLFNYSRTKLLISNDIEISEESYQMIVQIIHELKSYKPIQYILGNTEFYNLSYHVTSEVLIPRPETEELVDWIIQENQTKSLKILDIGTGSGCIAISLAKNIHGSLVFASDISNDALILTRKNSKLNNSDIQILHLDILKQDVQLKERFDIIVSNPPYITEKEKSLMHKNVLDFEPELALFVSNENPLIFYKAIINFSLNHLNPGGKLYVEINEAYGKETSVLLEENFFHNIELKKDINGKDRMLRGILR